VDWGRSTREGLRYSERTKEVVVYTNINFSLNPLYEAVHPPPPPPSSICLVGEATVWIGKYCFYSISTQIGSILLVFEMLARHSG
jgi:hypothetical protein